MIFDKYFCFQDPRTICIQLNMCDQKTLENIKTIDIVPSDNAINVRFLFLFFKLEEKNSF